MKRILFLFVAFVTVICTYAQSDDGDADFIAKERKNAFLVGPKLGGTLTSMTDPDECKLKDGSGLGFSGGLAAKARFGKASENSIGGTGLFGVGFEVKFKQNVAKTIATDEDGGADAKLSLSYLEIPVYVQVYPLIQSTALNTLYIEVGASVAMLMSRSPKMLSIANPSAEYADIIYHIDSDGSKLKGGDIRPLVGIGYTIPNTGLDINARYYLGTSELADNFKCKMNTFELSLAWMFNICKF